ncbi:helix-turn-helix domain-containing protein [Kribbella solani]|uniref:DNA-binding XRE family transcriptional regulator n=1 Tax=Kribbella solani TaxID=236067 RepID=A0A841DUU9_9ACTN|nr:helix-turn-helix transcriptional regulator [Kribbella solani]MBB5982864.1 DNA-binding XRE family transcriptional regulator [Kribbella solani]MDX2971938.1 helix-turn-helix transcriptional regulator [Kribbella solani]
MQVDTSQTAPEFYLREFAEMLKQVRGDAGLTVRELGAAIGHHHSRIVRAEQGANQPTWELTRAYLCRCSVRSQELSAWSLLWDVTYEAERLRKRGPDAMEQSEGVKLRQLLQERWPAAVARLAAPHPLVTKLRMVTTKRELGIALQELGARLEPVSIRQLAEWAGVPKTTLHDWTSGRRLPDSKRLVTVVSALRATKSEADEFRYALERISGKRCDGVHVGNRRPCVLWEYHRGPHRTSRGHEWLDDGD